MRHPLPIYEYMHLECILIDLTDLTGQLTRINMNCSRRIYYYDNVPYLRALNFGHESTVQLFLLVEKFMDMRETY